jgi:hypothetical protein
MYCSLQFQKRSQYFIGPDNEVFSVAMRVHNQDCSPFKIQIERPVGKNIFYNPKMSSKKKREDQTMKKEEGKDS